MKIRSSFISNSSSTSFIVAVPNKEEECGCCHRSNKWVLQAIAKYMTTMTDKGNKLYSMFDGEQVEQYFKQQLLDHMGSKAYAEEQLKALEELEKTPDLYENYKRLSKQLERARYSANIAREAAHEKEVGKYPSHEDTLKKRKEAVQRHIDEYDEKLDELKSIIKKVRKAIKNNYTVYAFTVDNWATDAESALKRMMTDKVIECIWSKST